MTDQTYTLSFEERIAQTLIDRQKRLNAEAAEKESQAIRDAESKGDAYVHQISTQFSIPLELLTVQLVRVHDGVYVPHVVLPDGNHLEVHRQYHNEKWDVCLVRPCHRCGLEIQSVAFDDFETLALYTSDPEAGVPWHECEGRKPKPESQPYEPFCGDVREDLRITHDQFVETRALVGSLRRKRDELKRALQAQVDQAYAAGLVEGKNEREREAWLRSYLPETYQQLADCETELTEAESLLVVAEADWSLARHLARLEAANSQSDF